MYRLLSGAALAALLSVPALAAEVADLTGKWVFTQSDGRGGPGCLMTLGTEQTDAGAMSASIDNKSCFDVTEGVTGWLIEGETLTLYKSDGATAIALTDTHNPDAVIYEDATKTYYMERIDAGQ